MGIRQNIFISIIIHTMVIASVLFVGCRIRDTAYCVPATYMVVSLFKEMTGSILTASQSTKRHKNPPSSPFYKGELTTPLIPLNKGGMGVVNGSKGGFENVFSDKNNRLSPSETINDTGLNNNVSVITKNQYSDKSEGITFSQNVGLSKITSFNQADTKDLFAIIRNAIEKAKIYPLFARKRKIEGTVITGFTIDNKGHPQAIKIEKSSGHTILDSAAIKIVRNAAPLPFVKGEIIVPISFRLTDHQTYTYR